jgi:hypothetical protein
MLEIEKRQAEPVEATSRRMPDAMIEHQPSAWRLDQRRGESDLVRVPPRALARRQQQLVPTPVPQIGRIRDPDVSTGIVHRTMDERVQPIDPTRQQSRVLVIGPHDKSVAVEAPKVLRERERDPWTALAVGRVGERAHPAIAADRSLVKVAIPQ